MLPRTRTYDKKERVKRLITIFRAIDTLSLPDILFSSLRRIHADEYTETDICIHIGHIIRIIHTEIVITGRNMTKRKINPNSIDLPRIRFLYHFVILRMYTF